MKIKFIGAIEHLTGSCSWLHYTKTNTQFLVDCGMYQGNNTEYLNTKEFPFDPYEIDFIFLTHAHLDHCGLIPRLYREGFSGKVYTTVATAKLAKIVLEDSANITQNNGMELYSKEDIALISFVNVDEDKSFHWGKQIRIDAGITASFLMSSHILGAASISISWAETPETIDPDQMKTMVFSGDIGNNTDHLSYLPLLKPNKYPFPTTDYMLVESTYGSHVREAKYKSSKNRVEQLNTILSNTILKKGGKALIPTFSIHRSQEILIDIVAWLNSLKLSDAIEDNGDDTKERKIHILCHSPMIAKVCQVYFEELNRTINTKKGAKKQYLSKALDIHINDEDFFPEKFKYLFNTIKEKGNKRPMSKLFYGNHEITVDSKQPNNLEKFDIIISSSGMCDAGPICNYLEMYEDDPNNTIILTGYQSSGSKGSQLLQRVDINDDMYPFIQAEVINISSYYSGHADQAVLFDYIFNIGKFVRERTPVTIFINHGELSAKQELKSAIDYQIVNTRDDQRLVCKVMIAEKTDQWFNLSAGEYEQADTSENEISITDLHHEMKIMNRVLRDLALSNQRILKTLNSCNKK